MGEFIDFIFSNLFLIVIIISAIVGFLGSNKEEQKKKQQRNPNRTSRPRPNRQAPRQQPRHEPVPTAYPAEESIPSDTVEKMSQDVVETINDKSISVGSVGEEQRVQLERMERRFGGNQDSRDQIAQGIHPSLIDGMKEIKKDIYEKEKKELRNDLSNSLRKKGLINGIIMAEVLGKPRAIHPYKSVIRDREIK